MRLIYCYFGVFFLAFGLGVSVASLTPDSSDAVAGPAEVIPDEAVSAVLASSNHLTRNREASRLQALIGDRDLWQYDNLGRFTDCLAAPYSPESEGHSDEVRMKLMEHWNAKTRAVARFDFRVGFRSSNYALIFIEPDNNGEWHFITRLHGTNKLIERVGTSVRFGTAKFDETVLSHYLAARTLM